jgi:aconitase A
MEPHLDVTTRSPAPGTLRAGHCRPKRKACDPHPERQQRDPALRRGVVIAAITSCTNTSNPHVLMGAGLLAKKRWSAACGSL